MDVLRESPYEGYFGSIPKVVCELEKDKIYYLAVRVLLIFCIAQKTTRAEKLRYGVPWFRGASCSEGKVLGEMLYGCLRTPGVKTP